MTRSAQPKVPPTPPPHMLAIPSRATVRRNPVESQRLLLLPIEPVDGPELWDAVDGSRWHLERWLPWVPFSNTPEASQRYAEACASDWDAGRAVRFAIRDRQTRTCSGWWASTPAFICTALASSATGSGGKPRAAA